MSGITKKLGLDAPSYNAGEDIASQKEKAKNQALYGTYGVDSDLGKVQVVENPDGTFSKKYVSSEADISRNKLISQGLGGLSLDPTSAENAYYKKATRQLMPQFEQDRESLEQSLANRGIMPGTEQYDRLIEKFESTKQGTLSDIANQSVFSGQQLVGSQIGNVGALASQRDVNALTGMGGSTGANFTGTYENQLAANQAKAQGRQQLLGAGIGAATAVFSDIRLKENLIPVGKLDNGLIVYVGNYKQETGLDTRPQLFLIAQEVKEVKPEAVYETEDGYLMVNYKEAVK